MNAVAVEMFADDDVQTRDSPASIELVVVTVAELGLADGAIKSAVIDAALARGLALCPREVAPHLRLALLDQEEGAAGVNATPGRAPPGALTVVDHRPSHPEGAYRGFYLRRIEGKLWLRGYNSWYGHVWDPSDALVFAVAGSLVELHGGGFAHG